MVNRKKNNIGNFARTKKGRRGERGQLDHLSGSLISLLWGGSHWLADHKVSLTLLGTWSCVEGKGSADFSLKLMRALLNTSNVSPKPNIHRRGVIWGKWKGVGREENPVHGCQPDTFSWRHPVLEGRAASLFTDAHSRARPAVMSQGTCLWSGKAAGAPSHGGHLLPPQFGRSFLGLSRQIVSDHPPGTSAASLMLILFQILVLLPNAHIFSKFTLFVVINHHAKLLEWLDFSSAEKPGARLGSVFLHLSRVSSLANPSYATIHVSKTFLLPSTVHQIHPVLLFKAVSGRTRWASTN